MIVRDESATIERAVASVLPVISSWRIIDTGSVDDTIDRTRRALTAVPGELRESGWTDFAVNRTELVSWASQGAEADDWLLLLDADMTIEFHPDLADRLSDFDGDAALVEVLGGLRYRMPYLVRANRPWHYVGRTHEFLSSDEPFITARFEALRIVHHADGGSRGQKFERDLELLTAALREHPDDPRSLFYLAQTQRDRGEHAAARELYRRRADLGGWDEEVFVARMQQGVMEHELGLTEATETLQEAWELRPTRAEPLYHLARINRLRRRHHLAWVFANLAVSVPRPDDALFVEDWVYVWASRFEKADAAWRIGEGALAARLCHELLAEGAMPDDHREHLEYVLRSLDEQTPASINQPAPGSNG
jgi:tetratricopeptide (TPR) repeat protein